MGLKGEFVEQGIGSVQMSVEAQSATGGTVTFFFDEAPSTRYNSHLSAK
jgi:hypothetical protein